MTEINRQHLRLLEALLFASAEPLSERLLDVVGVALRRLHEALHGVKCRETAGFSASLERPGMPSSTQSLATRPEVCSSFT